MSQVLFSLITLNDKIAMFRFEILFIVQEMKLVNLCSTLHFLKLQSPVNILKINLTFNKKVINTEHELKKKKKIFGKFN